MAEKVIIIGAFKEMIEAVEAAGFSIAGLVDPDNSNARRFNYPYLGADATFLLEKEFIEYHVLFTPDLPDIRRTLYNLYCCKNSYMLLTLLSPHAEISPSAVIKEGTVVLPGVNVSADVCIGVCCRLNCRANIMHNTVLEDYVTVAPNAVLLGNVSVGEGSYIGANATILPRKKIGKNVIVGAGAVVTKDVPDNVVVCGNPATFLRKS